MNISGFVGQEVKSKLMCWYFSDYLKPLKPFVTFSDHKTKLKQVAPILEYFLLNVVMPTCPIFLDGCILQQWNWVVTNTSSLNYLLSVPLRKAFHTG
jgi:hypothetical protein